MEENWDKVVPLHIDILAGIEDIDIKSRLPESLGEKRPTVENFIRALWRFYKEMGFTYLEINPFTFYNGSYCASGYGGQAR